VAGGIIQGQSVGAIKAAVIGALVLALSAWAAPASALPYAPMPVSVSSAGSEKLLLIRHHHHHGHWRHRRSHGPGGDEPEAALPGADAPAASGLSPPEPSEPSLQAMPGRASRGSGSSRPAIRWVDPEKQTR
jgi:hypothetical protein